ncbi:hypothetical protein ACIGN6_36205 [Streptomyces sp. NPDC053792]|uniref:hypothetical protein n=1 Tax=Streptomyces sp. NPDC053792 TaxID=3365716 RepID=UPI0037D375D8
MHLLNGHLRSPRQAEASDREAVQLLTRAGFIDTSIRFGQETVPTAARMGPLDNGSAAFLSNRPKPLGSKASAGAVPR